MSAAVRHRALGTWSSVRHPVVAVGLGLIAVQLTFRAAALFNGWFYADDFEFLTDATGESLSIAFLVQPHDSQFMPAGQLAAWVVAHSGPFNWPVAAAIIIAFQASASIACLVMLVELFGHRWACLGFLGLYLFSTLTLTAFMWWAAAINHVPFQLAFFLAVILHTRYLRARRVRYALAAGVVIVLALLFYVKSALIVVPLATFTALYFHVPEGTWRQKLGKLGATHWRAALVYASVIAVYAAYYVRNVPNPISPSAPVSYGDLLDAMVRVSLATSAAGGPWWWSNENPPLGQVDTAPWAITATWVGLAVLVTIGTQRRVVDWRALGVFLPYLAIAYVLVARGRGAQLGGFAGLELRYLADSAPVLTFAAALFCIRLREHPSRVPAQPHAQVKPTLLADWIPLTIVALLLVACTISNLQYVRFWSAPYPAKAYMKTVMFESRATPLLLVDEPVPELVMSATSYPSNLPSRMFAPLGKDRVDSVTSGNDLQMLNSLGQPFPAVVTPRASSTPGPADDCGYVVRGRDTRIDLVGEPDYFWWMQISYLASDDGTLAVTVAGETQVHEVERGAHRLLVQGEGPVGAVTVRSGDGIGTCVDSIAVGAVSPLEPLS